MSDSEMSPASKTSDVHRVVMRLRRWWSAFTQTGTGGLIQHGDWRVLYPDGKRTHYMSHGDADNYREIFGGTLEWRYDA
jgi:hypothetical protein